MNQTVLDILGVFFSGIKSAVFLFAAYLCFAYMGSVGKEKSERPFWFYVMFVPIVVLLYESEECGRAAVSGQLIYFIPFFIPMVFSFIGIVRLAIRDYGRNGK